MTDIPAAVIWIMVLVVAAPFVFLAIGIVIGILWMFWPLLLGIHTGHWVLGLIGNVIWAGLVESP